MHEHGEAVLLATPRPVGEYPTMLDALKVSWIGRLPLVVFDFGGAIGTRVLPT